MKNYSAAFKTATQIVGAHKNHVTFTANQRNDLRNKHTINCSDVINYGSAGVILAINSSSTSGKPLTLSKGY